MSGGPPAAAPPGSLPDPASSGIEHVVLVTMENRSFDHFLGWLPGADGRQAGLVYRDRSGASRPTHPLAQATNTRSSCVCSYSARGHHNFRQGMQHSCGNNPPPRQRPRQNHQACN